MRATDHTSHEWKNIIINYLLDTGYASFAYRFYDINFLVTAMYDNDVDFTAFMMESKNLIVINAGFFNYDENDKAEEKLQMDRVSVLCRHELLHFVLGHNYRFVQYLKQKYPHSWGKVYAKPDMHRIANFAMDYDLCNEAYEPEDKEIIRNLALNGRVCGGLITEEEVTNSHTSIWFEDGTKEDFSGSQFNNWEHKPMEEMWQELANEHAKYSKCAPDFGGLNGNPKKQPLTMPDISKESAEYQAAYKKVFDMFKDNPDGALELFGRLRADEPIDLDTYKESLTKGV